MAIFGGGFLAPKLIDELIIAQGGDAEVAMSPGRPLGPLSQGGHVVAGAVAGQDQDATETESMEVLEQVVDVGSEGSEGEGDRSGELARARADAVRQSGGHEPRDAGREVFGGPFGLDHVGGERQVGAMGLQRAHWQNEERVPSDLLLEGSGIHVVDPVG